MPTPIELKDCIEPALGLLGGGFIGFVWFQSAIVANGLALRKWTTATAVANSVFALATVTGGLLFTRWHGSVSPVNGLAWIAGLISGFWAAYKHVVDSIVGTVLSECRHHEREEVGSLVRGRLIRDGARATEDKAVEVVRKWQNPDKELSLRITAQLHRFIHAARNRAALEFPKIGRGLVEASKGKASFDLDLSAYLEEVVGLYRELLAELIGQGDHLWVALRRLDPDGSYRTIIRKGNVDSSERAKKSEPVSASKGLPKLLEDNLNDGPVDTRGVIFLGPDDKKKKKKWQKMQNDGRHEDMYVMAAPITIRRSSVGADGQLERQMAMILYANHTNNVFPPWLCDVVRCCVDTVSVALSVGIQLIDGVTRASVTATTPPVGALVAPPIRAQVSSGDADNHAKSGAIEERADAPKTG